VQRFKDIKAWQLAHHLALAVCRATTTFPADVRFGLAADLRRAAVEVPASIAEGSRLRSQRAYVERLNRAEAALARTEALLLVAIELGHLPASLDGTPLAAVEEVGRTLGGLRRSVERDLAAQGGAEAPLPRGPLDSPTHDGGRQS
jgi:four helix bundle protein